MIKVIGFYGSDIKTKFAGVDLWEICEPVSIVVNTDIGILRYFISPGFLTDMRSGSHAIDRIIPKFTKNNKYNLAILTHDVNYTKNETGGHFIEDREKCDEMLRQMALASGEIGSIRAAIMYRAVRLFGNSAYNADNDKYYGGFAAEISKFMRFRWDAK